MRGGRQIREAALLALLAALATLGALTLDAGTPLRIAAGIVLLLALPWLAASRLAPIRESNLMGGRVSGSGALAVALVVLLGLLLAAVGDGITTRGVALGMLIVTAALAMLGRPADRPLPRPDLDGQRVLGLTLTATAIAIAVLSFTIARDRALTQGQEEAAYAAFLVEDGDRLDVGLSNSTGRRARFTVRDVNEAGGRTASVTVPPKSTGTVEGFVDRPPGLRPLERLEPRRIEPVRIRVTVTAGGRPMGPVLELSTYGP